MMCVMNLTPCLGIPQRLCLLILMCGREREELVKVGMDLGWRRGCEFRRVKMSPSGRRGGRGFGDSGNTML